MESLRIEGLPLSLVRKRIRHLYIRVLPPEGRVVVSAPLRFSEEAVRRAVSARLPWIRRQQKRLGDRRHRPEVSYRFVPGEKHFFRGRAYRLEVIERQAPSSVSVGLNGTLTLSVRPGAGPEAREHALGEWYRRRLRQEVPRLLAKWEPVIGISVSEVRVKKMKTLWGSCNLEARRLWLNLDLARKDPACLEYILVHEMTHLIERRHNGRFHALMDGFLPSWRELRAELNRPLEA